MKIVLDTNVLVSGLLSPFGVPGEIVRLIASGVLMLCYDVRILSEYRLVLLRPKFGFNIKYIDSLLEQIENNGELIISEPLKLCLPDPDDEMFLEIAYYAKVKYLVTGNLRHFPISKRQGISVLTPSEFIKKVHPTIV